MGVLWDLLMRAVEMLEGMCVVHSRGVWVRLLPSARRAGQLGLIEEAPRWLYAVRWVSLSSRRVDTGKSTMQKQAEVMN